MNRIDEIADALHDEQCTRNRCSYWLQRGGDGAHRLYYQQQAQIMFTRLVAVIGAADVLPVVRIIMEEMW